MGEIPAWGIRINAINGLKYLRFYGARSMSKSDFETLTEADDLLVRLNGNLEASRRIVMFRDSSSGTCWPALTQAELVKLPVKPICGAAVARRVPRYGTGKTKDATICQVMAGRSTSHLGVGHCSSHSGNSRRENMKAAWLMAHAFAREMDITPWEALLKAVRIAAGKLEYAQYKISTATHDLELEGRVVRGDDGLLVDPDSGEPLGVGGLHDLTFWVKQAEMWHERLLRSSKAAIDSGIAERLMAGQTLQVQLISRVVEAGLGTLRLSPGDEASARAAMRAELLRIDHEKQAAIEGELLESIAIGPIREQV